MTGKLYVVFPSDTNSSNFKADASVQGVYFEDVPGVAALATEASDLARDLIEANGGEIDHEGD